VLALALIAVLILDTLYDTVSVQVVEVTETSGKSFALGQAFSADQVIRLELAAQGKSAQEIAELMNNPDEMRVFRLRNRVELMWATQDGPLRWVVSSLDDERVNNYSLFEGLRRWNELKQGLQENQQLRLNPWLDYSFLTRDPSRNPISAGLRVALFGTIWLLSMTLLISVPIGVGTAIYLEEYAPKNRLTRFIEVNLRNLAGVPSIVFGLLGLAVFVRGMNLGPTLMAASLTMALLIMPTISIAAREALRAVPDSMRLAAYALGATKWQMVSKVVLPATIPGVATGVILAAARAIGEAAPLLMVGAAAYVAFIPRGPLSEYTVLPVQIYLWISANLSEFANTAAAGIVVLLLTLGGLYALAFWVRRRYRVEW
jgi:phosphate transport system permease protein